MSDAVATTVPRTASRAGRDSSDDRRGGTAVCASFLRWGLTSYLVVVAVTTLATLLWLDGAWAYVLDDPAIHLSVADRLAHDGTWGVVAGRFESASSAPLWTVLLAGGVALAAPVAHALPLLLNVAAGVAVLWLLAREQSVLRPGRDRPADAAATILLVTVVLFLPGLALVGMEHTLHVALVLAAVVAVDRWVHDRPGPGPAAVGALVVLATLARFETAFVAVGLAAALLVVDRRAHRGRAALVLAASGLTVVGFGVFNRALGGDWLPNSVLAKGQAPSQAQSDGLGPVDTAGRLTHDPVLALLVGVAVVYLVVWGRRGRAVVPAIVLVVAAALHAALADVGWYERYQAYLIAVGVYGLLHMLTELPPAVRRRAVVAVCLLAAVFGLSKINLTVKAPLASDDMYRQQYQAGRFLDAYYDGEPVATDQLGYISWFHRGPLTDFAGLGDRAVLETRRGDEPRSEVWAGLAAERGFRVVVLYDTAAAFNVPGSWILAGEWRLDGEPVTGVSDTLQFWATVPGEVEPLQDHLRDFADDMPDRTRLHVNKGAPLQAYVQEVEQSEATGGGGQVG